MLFACTGVVLAQQERNTPEKAQSHTSETSQPEVVKGSFHVQWGDPPRREPRSEAKTEYVLVDDEGKASKLQLDERDTEAVGGPRAFNGKRVEVRGSRVPDRPEDIDVEAINFERSEDAAKARAKVEAGESADAQVLEESTTDTTSGKPWVTIGCRFAGSTELNKPVNDRRDYYQRLMGVNYEPDQTTGEIIAKMTGERPGMDHYWKEISSNNINLSSSQVGDGTKQVKFWYQLEGKASDYADGSAQDREDILKECTAKADEDVDFRNFMGINLVLSDTIGCCAWGGSRELTLDGQTENYAVTWLPQPFASGHDWFSHEMGHGFGLPHSSGPYRATYDSEWDVMSGSGVCDEAKPDGVRTLDGATIKPILTEPAYKCISVDTISYHADLLKWITNRKYEVNTTGTHRGINIERLDQPPNSSGYLMAKIPIKGSKTQFYTVEARRLKGSDSTTSPYDGDLNGRIPGEAVVIHKVNTTLGDRNAKVVDSTTSGSNPNDAGAMWLLGETFTDKTNGITIKVVGENSSKTGYIVDITRTR